MFLEGALCNVLAHKFFAGERMSVIVSRQHNVKERLVCRFVCIPEAILSLFDY